MLKTEHIKIRVTKDERNLIESYANTKGSTISKVLRNLVNNLKEQTKNEFK